jgi:hypothetical protein
MWTLTISPESIGIVMDPLLFTSILAVVEIARRAQWNIFRVENEQLNNIGKFRAIDLVLPPAPKLPTKKYERHKDRIGDSIALL